MSSGATVVCLGAAGGMGSMLGRRLASSQQVGRLILADRDREGAAQLARSLGSGASCAVEAAEIDVLDADALRALLDRADLVANAAGPFFRLGVPTLEVAIESRTPYLDICDDPEPTERMLELDEQARAAGIAAVVGMGASPGLSNLLARRAADRLDRVIDCYTVWPLDVDAPGDTGAALDAEAGAGPPSAAAVHLMEQISGEISVVVDGRLVKASPLSPVTLDYPGLGSGTAVTVGHPEPVTLHRSLGVEGRAANLMLVKRTTAPFLDSLRRDIDAGELDLEGAAAELLRPSTARGLAALPRAIGAKGPGSLPPFFALLRGVRGGDELRVGCHATTLPPGMDGVTSIPAALAIERLLASPAPPGVHAPETAIDAEALLEALCPHCPGSPASVDELAPVSEGPA